MHLPPNLALLIYLGFVVWLFRRDIREKPNVTGALWIPFFWVFISGSRFVSEWLDIVGLHVGGTSVEEGSPVDAVFFFGLIGAGIYVLRQRQVSLAEFMRNNPWVAIYLAYCFVSILWSDFPLVAFKRWIKLCGQPVMVLIVLTEPAPLEALVRLFKRLAYVWIPVSILFIKYFQDLGRSFSYWTGQAENNGICTGKNGLGFLCMIVGFFFFWHFLTVRQWEKGAARRSELILCVGFLAMDYWLLHLAQSSTSLVCMLVASGVVLFLGLRFVNVRHIGAYLAAGIVIAALTETLFGIHDAVIAALGKDPTLTGRTEVWQFLLKADINPVLGCGFESFWLSDIAKDLNSNYDFHSVVFNEAHNGYLETYLNLGLLGLALTVGLIGAAFLKARQALINNFNFGRFRLAYLVAVLIYNWTEAAFRTHSVPFFLFFLCAMDYPARLPAAEPVAGVNIGDEPDEDLMESPQPTREQSIQP
jgi:O-antigen ligase